MSLLPDLDMSRLSGWPLLLPGPLLILLFFRFLFLGLRFLVRFLFRLSSLCRLLWLWLFRSIVRFATRTPMLLVIHFFRSSRSHRSGCHLLSDVMELPYFILQYLITTSVTRNGLSCCGKA